MESCNVCGNTSKNLHFNAKEMLRGTRDVFQYIECGECKCIQIVNPPADMSSYYDNSYYESFSRQTKNLFLDWVREIRDKYAIRRKTGFIGRVLSWIRPLPPDFTIVGKYATNTSKILDVGCGSGSYIRILRRIGFENVTGIDPYLKEDQHLKCGLTILRSYIEDVKDLYDVILSHHSLEHVPHPLDTLVAIRKALAPGGVCILTVPVAEDLYRKYKSDCYLIQAPQHFYLFSIESIKILASKAGFSIKSIIRDSNANLEWYIQSELWAQNISSNESAGRGVRLLSKSKRKELRLEFTKIKKNQKGDNVVFVLGF